MKQHKKAIGNQQSDRFSPTDNYFATLATKRPALIKERWKDHSASAFSENFHKIFWKKN